MRAGRGTHGRRDDQVGGSPGHVPPLGPAQLDEGDLINADVCLSRLLSMNPSDNQGIRHLMGKPDSEMGAPGMR